MVDKKNDAFDLVPRRVCDEIAQVFSEFDVSSSVEEVPDDVLVWPEESDEAVYSFVVAECGDVDGLSLFRPASFDFAEEFNPFLVLKGNENLFFKRAGAMRL